MNEMRFLNQIAEALDQIAKTLDQIADMHKAMQESLLKLAEAHGQAKAAIDQSDEASR
jgi:prefoldin subunit 5